MENTKIELKGAIVRYVAYIVICLLMIFSGFVYSNGSFATSFWLTELILLLLGAHLLAELFNLLKQIRGL